MRFTFLTENKTYSSGIGAEHGLSIFIQTHGKNILFDAGSTDLPIINAAKLGIDLKEADLAVISHGHYDHTGGFPAFAEINSRAPIYIHEHALIPTFDRDDMAPTGIQWTADEMERLESRLVFTDRELWIDDDIVISGTIDPVDEFKPTEVFLRRDMTADPMDHEQFLAVREGDELYVFSGCSHRGAVAVIRHAGKLFPGMRIKAFIAGMHMYSATEEDRARVIAEVVKEDIDILVPVHCTGIEAIITLKGILKDRCVVASAGETYEY